MKFTVLCVAALAVYVAAESEPINLPSPPPALPEGAGEEGIFQNIGRAARRHLKILRNEVSKDLLNSLKDILTDGLQLNPTIEAREALQGQVPSNEGIFEATGDLLLQRAAEIAAQHTAEYHQENFSHEGIVLGFGNIYRISEAEELIHAQYNRSLQYGFASHEGILGSLGGIIVNGLGNLIGGQAGNILEGVGNVIGNLFYVIPNFPISREGIIPEQANQEGIISSAGNLILKGASGLAGDVLRGAFAPICGLLGNIFLARGNFNRYPNLRAPANEIILNARHRLHNEHPDAGFCLDAAEYNFTLLSREYKQRGIDCIRNVRPHARRIINNVQDIVLDAVRRVEYAHRDTDFCFDKYIEENKIVCLEEDIPERIAAHRRRIAHYSREMAGYVREFSDLNAEFDVCLVGHLGVVRREVYQIINDFDRCFRPKKSTVYKIKRDRP